jgi:KAP family P-loop domain
VLQRASPLIQPLRKGGWKYSAAVAGAILLPVLIGLLLARLHAPAAGSALAVVLSFIGTAAGYVRLGTRWIRTGLDQLAEAQRQIESAAQEKRTQLDNAVTAAERRLSVAEQRLAEAHTKERELDAQVIDLEHQLAETTASRMLTEFIAERTGSDDYRKRLGVQALVRQDLERLSELVAGTSEEGDPEQGVQYPVNRVVLYIDDLDRCPTRLVVEVLQAVHLLLAFPLFVVVVAVDSRWLAGALRDHYRELLVEGSASPDDYLEKIFQVPFWVRPLSPQARRRMARRMLEPNLELTQTTETDADASSADEQEEVGQEFFDLVESFGLAEGAAPPWLEAARLTVTLDELDFVDGVALLLGDTPRSIKRFVNVYQLVKAIGRRRQLALDKPTPNPSSDELAPPPPQARVILLLVIATRFPELLQTLATRATCHRETTMPLGKAITGLTSDVPGRNALHEWLIGRPEWDSVDLVQLLPWIRITERFTFRSVTNGLLEEAVSEHGA